MKINRMYVGQTLRIAVGITLLVLLMMGGAGATKSINDNATGGDCISIGTWIVASKTCTLTTDLTETIEIDSDGITLDGYGHTITGSNTGNGIYLSGRNGVMIKNTNVRSFSEGIYLLYSSNNTLAENTALNNGEGISLYSSSYNTLSGNNASNNNGYGIIILEDSNNNIMSGSTASNNYWGISLASSSNNMLRGNNASNNFYGFIIESSRNSNLIGNIANSNLYDGFIMYASTNNILIGNIANSNKDYGINIFEASGNTIYNNHFNNMKNAWTDMNNIWNTPKTPGTNIIGGPYLGGNYWVYPNGTGFSQTCADNNSDGICDSPYALDSNNIDYLPLAITPIPTFNISGYKINSATGSGISGWNITLTNSTMQTNMLTSSDGSYKFSNLVNGTYNVVEETRPGFTNVTPTSVQIVIAGSDAININFTNKLITSQQQIQQITIQVQGLVTSHVLNQGQGTSLIAKLDDATKNLNMGNTKAALNELQAFIKEVQAYIRARILTQAQGQELIDSTNAVISQLVG
jgi:parallel beta-helix repeat protein